MAKTVRQYLRSSNHDTIDILASISQTWLYDGQFMNEVSFNEKPALILVLPSFELIED